MLVLFIDLVTVIEVGRYIIIFISSLLLMFCFMTQFPNVTPTHKLVNILVIIVSERKYIVIREKDTFTGQRFFFHCIKSKCIYRHLARLYEAITLS